MTRLVTVAHGTRVTEGNLVAAEITARASALLGVDATTSYVELCAPLLDDVMLTSTDRSVVVPLLLSTGFHVKHDIPGSVATSPASTSLAQPLGPHPLLARAMCERLRAAGAAAGSPVVMVAAGSNDPEAAHDLDTAAAMLAECWGASVRVATVSGAGRPVAEVVREARADGDVAVAPYLLSPGFFSRRATEAALEAGAVTVSDVIGAHPLVVDLVVLRYRVALAVSRVAA